MIESVFLLIMIMGFILTLVSVEKKSLIYSILSIVIWLLVMAQSHYIYVPCDTAYSELGVNAISLAFIFFGVIWTIVCYMDIKGDRRLP